jgi:protein CpxP
MKRTRVLAFAALLAAALAAGTALAQVPDREGGRRGPGRMGAFAPDAGLPLRALNLTDAPKEQIRTLAQQRSDEHRAVASKLREAFDAQRKAADAMPVDEQAIRSTTQALADAQTVMAIQRAKLRADIFALLTPEQQAQAAKLKAEREARPSSRRDGARQAASSGLTREPSLTASQNGGLSAARRRC